MKDDEPQTALVRLWLDRSEDKCTEVHLMVFHGWLQRNRPELLSKRHFGDSYQNLKSDLRHTQSTLCKVKPIIAIQEFTVAQSIRDEMGSGSQPLVSKMT